MKNTSTKNFKNKFFLTFKDEKTADLYYRSIYTFLKSFSVSLLSYCFLVVNLVLLTVYGVETSSRIKNLQVFLLIFEGVAIILYVLYNKLNSRLKDEKSFFCVNLLVSMMNLFNIYLQPNVTREALKNVASSSAICYLIPFAQNFLMVMFLYFVDNNFLIYLIDFIISFVLMSSLAIGNSWTESIFSFVVIILGGISYSFLVYLVNLREKNIFLVYIGVVTDLEKKKNFVDNLNSGLITIDENGYDYNLKILEYINFNAKILNTDKNVDRDLNNSNFINENSHVNHLESLRELNDSKENVNYELNTLLFDKYREFNPSLDKDLKSLFESAMKISLCVEKDEKEIKYKKLIKNFLHLMGSNEIYQTYAHIGDKIFKKSSELSNIIKEDSKTLRVYLRYNIVSSSLEFFLSDISSVIEVEHLKASFKYKKLFLNKFSHEFKNPLMNIVELVSDIKRKMVDGSRIKDCYQNYSLDKHTVTNKTLPHDVKRSTLKLNLHKSEIRLDGLESLNEIKHIKNSSMHLISLIEDFDFISNSDMTFYSKNDRIQERESKLPFIEISKFRPIKIIKQCVNVLQSKIELSDKNIKVSCLIDENIPIEIYSDYRRLKQVISNILSNAFKFTSMGEISITVKNDAFNENLINFEIRDTGIGFREDILKLIHDGKTHMLFGNINSGSNIYGCGIGVDLVEKIISQIGVNLKFSSKIDSGSTVTFSIYNRVDQNSRDLENSNIAYSARSSKNANKTTNNAEFSPRSILRKPHPQRSKSCRSNSYKSLFNNNYEQFRDLESEDEIKFKSDGIKIENSNQISQPNLNVDRLESKLKLGNENFTLRKHDSNRSEYTIKITNCDNNFVKSNDVRESVDDDDEDYDAKTVVIDQMMTLHSHCYPYEKTSNLELESERVTKQNNNLCKIVDKRENNENFQADGVVINEPQLSTRSKQVGVKLSNSMRRDSIKCIKILLVDDEKFIRQSESNQIKKFLAAKANFQYEITECSDGVECLYEIFKGIKEGIKYDYIITDESMNFMTGSSMIKYLNTLHEEKIMYGIKKYMVTSYEPWAVINTHGLICDAIISKPLSFENLTKIFLI